MSKRSNRELIEEIIKQEGWTDQVENNRQTLLLLVHNEKFQAQVTSMRNQFKIPLKKGFHSGRQPVKKWVAGLDELKWNNAINSIFISFPRITENFRQHIEIYIKFNSIYYAPILDHQISYPQLDRKARDSVMINIFNPPDEKEWDLIKKEINAHFMRHDVTRKKVIEKFYDKLSTLDLKETIASTLYTTDTEGKKVTDQTLADKYNKDGSHAGEIKAINLVRQYRKRLKSEMKKRLG